jgi:hypothetical protein
VKVCVSLLLVLGKELVNILPRQWIHTTLEESLGVLFYVLAIQYERNVDCWFCQQHLALSWKRYVHFMPPEKETVTHLAITYVCNCLWTEVFGCVFSWALHSKCYHCVLSPMSFGVCYLIVGTMSLDMYIYIIHPVTMPRITEYYRSLKKKVHFRYLNEYVYV